MIIADTDVLIDALHGKEPSRATVDQALKMGNLTTTVVNQFELLSGAKTPKQRESIDRLLAAAGILTFDSAASREAARLRIHLEATGLGIGMADYLIAGICLTRGATLLTRNHRHFERIKGLSLMSMDP